MLIIGCGNRERGDDAAGVLVLERLLELGAETRAVTLKACTGEATELMDSFRADDQVVIVDAVVTGAAAGTVHQWEGDIPAPAGSPSASTHGFGVLEAVRLAQALECLPGFLRIYGIEARQFEAGTVISPEVQHAVEQVAQQIRAEIPLTTPA